MKIDIVMSIKEAQKYISDHRKRQSDPFLWPDFMTGLPDRSAVQKTLDTYFSKQKTHVIAYICISNIQPYLVKYGSKKHIEIIQWAAGILKTTADVHKGFVGILDTHDFVAVVKKTEFDKFIKTVTQRFAKKTRSFYTDKDLKNDYVLSFSRDGKDVEMGLMSLAFSCTEGREIPRERLLQELERSCSTK